MAKSCRALQAKAKNWGFILSDTGSNWRGALSRQHRDLIYVSQGEQS